MDMEQMRQKCEAASDRFAERIQSMHTDRYECSVWETWTEHNAPLFEGGRADVTFNGCQTHHIALAV